ncbi:hypothetical protein IVA95_28235 [Bradyrhizobium sp. 157]|uniref:hypothetical protein n=1 Tax=Bradyrhizobium sp. 157 TaxID=2782631 RepID=UPI001FF7FA32|nr:hypothetical protein [Bradyrhizobium sp. 157]MCK1641352.1 hypothetical protein [Bradyrhizobium sp. 157]
MDASARFGFCGRDDPDPERGMRIATGRTHMNCDHNVFCLSVVGPVVGLVGIEDGAVSKSIDVESSDVGAPDRRTHLEQQYHEVELPAV